IIHGSTRPGRGGLPVSHWIEKTAREHGAFNVELVDLGEVRLPLLDEPEHPAKQAYTHEHTKAWSRRIAPGDAFVFVTPEYDFFPSAALVNAIQCLSREWQNKPAGIVSYGGISGGLRAAETLKRLTNAVGLVTLGATVPVPMYAQFIENGALKPNEPRAAGAKALLDQLAKFTQTLAPLRA
ncbi:MAG TPA: NADPH-dependent FMN reductase, partial [Beijerinckiaceae bacterium]